MNLLQRVFSRASREDEGTATPSKTVTLETLPNNPEQEILRFGPNETDYFPVKGDVKDKEALREILSKVIESESMLKKIRDLPVEDRPVLVREDSKDWDGTCNGETIMIARSSGTGYRAAGIFAHEFQHQYQHKKGIALHNSELAIQDQILNDRIFESAADTACYQYMYEMRDKNPQARLAYLNTMLESPGLRSYANAKNAGKPEEEAVLAGMKGYAKNLCVANYYAKNYHDVLFAIAKKDLNIGQYSSNIIEGKRNTFIALTDRILNGKKMTSTAAVDALQAHTVGMTSKPIDRGQASDLINDPDYKYVTSKTARAIAKIQNAYKDLTGQKHANDGWGMWVRNGLGSFSAEFKEGVQGLAFKTGDALRKIKEPFKKKEHDIASFTYYYGGGKKALSFDGERTDPAQKKACIKYRSEAQFEKESDNNLSAKESHRREDKANKMFSILMKDRKIAKQLMNMDGDTVTLGFHDDIKTSATTDSNMILINPKMSPYQMASEFAKQLSVVQQHEEARKAAGYDSYKDYRLDKMKNDPKAYSEENARTEAKAGAEQGRFMTRMIDHAPVIDKIKTRFNPVARAFSKAFYAKDGTTYKALDAAAAKSAEVSGFDPAVLKKPQNNAAQEKPVEKAPEKQTEKAVEKTVEKTAEKQAKAVQITSRDVLAMADKMAFRASKSNQSETYYKPDDKEAALAQKLVTMTKEAVKAAGIDSRSAQVKDVRAKALADYAKTPEGKKDLDALMAASEKMTNFEKKPSLMQTLQTQPAKQSEPSLMQTLKTQPVKQQATSSLMQGIQSQQAAPKIPVQKGREL